MERTDRESALKPVKRLNATLPDTLAYYVAEMTSGHGLYETPSEFIRDLIRHHMEKTEKEERFGIDSLLLQSLAENNYSPLTEEDTLDVRRAIATE